MDERAEILGRAKGEARKAKNGKKGSAEVGYDNMDMMLINWIFFVSSVSMCGMVPVHGGVVQKTKMYSSSYASIVGWEGVEVGRDSDLEGC